MNEEIQFETLFKSNFRSLHSYAYTLLQDESAAEDIVQNVFLRLWEKREEIEIHTSLKSYLYKSVYNLALNYIRDQKTRTQHNQRSMEDSDLLTPTELPEEDPSSELKNRIQEALTELPEKCRTVFQLSRFEDLKYKEIAEQLDISVKTVEAHMGKALRILRTKLADYLPFIFLLLSILFL